MDFKTPCQIVLGLLLAFTALATLGLTADNVSYVHKHQNPSPVQIHYTRWNSTAEAQYSYWVEIDYMPSRLTLTRMYAMLAASIVCGLVGVGVAVASWVMRPRKTCDTEVALQERPNRFSALLYAVLGLTGVAFLLSLAIAIFAWQPVMRWTINFLKSLPVSRKISGAKTTGPIQYQSPFHFTPEVWNCFLAPYVVDPSQNRRMQSLCREGNAAKDLMVPMVIFSAVLLCSLLWAWRQARLSASSGSGSAPVKEVEEVSVHGRE